MSFIPKDYKLPVADGGYMRLVKGENRIRILSDSIQGFEWWIDTSDGRKPKRVRPDENIPVGELPADEKPKHFWAFVVWNYGKESVQILEITQKSIMKAIMTLYKNKDWGEPQGYDLTIIREGDGLETKYTATPSPKKKLVKDIVGAYAKTKINLEALYDGEDPFANHATDGEVTKTPEELLEETDTDDLPF